MPTQSPRVDFLTHLFVGRLLATFVGAGSVPLAALATLFAVLPDADTVTWAFPRLRRWLHHRGATHSLLFGVLASAAAGTLFAFAGWSSFGVAFAVALLAFLTHVGLDVLNWGCLLLWPARRARVEYTVHAGFAWSAALSTAGMVLLETLRRLAPEAVLPVALATSGLFVAYFALRVASRVRAGRRAPGRRLLPTANPFVWLVAGEVRPGRAADEASAGAT